MKIALVTGANKGIGFETAKQLAQVGCFVFLTCRSASLGEQTVEKLHRQGLENTMFVRLDVTDIDSIDHVVPEVEKKFGRLDILINNAGMLGGTPQDAINFSLEETRKVFETNYFGLIQVTQKFIPLLHNSSGGRIINISSPLASLADHGNPQWEFYSIKPFAYIPSKVAVNAYTIMLAYSLRDTKIRVKAVDPGYTSTDFNNFSGRNTPDHSARVVVKYALMDGDAPSGGFFDEHSEKQW